MIFFCRWHRFTMNLRFCEFRPQIFEHTVIYGRRPLLIKFIPTLSLRNNFSPFSPNLSLSLSLFCAVALESLEAGTASVLLLLLQQHSLSLSFLVAAALCNNLLLSQSSVGCPSSIRKGIKREREKRRN